MLIGHDGLHHPGIVTVVAEAALPVPTLMCLLLVEHDHEAVVPQDIDDAPDPHLHVNQIGEPTERDPDLRPGDTHQDVMRIGDLTEMMTGEMADIGRL
jgi:hypothetical protein